LTHNIMNKIDEIYEDLTSSMNNELTRLTQEKKRLDSEVRKLINERESPKNYNVERVLLDIGGHHFSTSIHTLTAIPDSYFGRLFSGPFPSHMVGEDGRVFLDRDGKHFRFILNFLRDPDHFELKLRNKQELDSLRLEAAFYEIEDKIFSKSIFIPDVQNWLDEKKIKIKSFLPNTLGVTLLRMCLIIVKRIGFLILVKQRISGLFLILVRKLICQKYRLKWIIMNVL